MQDVLSGLLILGGIAVFLVGLKRLAENFTSIIGARLERVIKKASKSSGLCTVIGAVASGLGQGSAAVNMIAVSLVDGNILSFKSACALIVGTNVGTTLTAQLVALTIDRDLLVVAIASLVAFLGVILELLSNKKLKATGKILSGLGLIFIGINLMTTFTKSLYDCDWFKGLFLVKSPLIVLLNGFFITAICQSSSVVTSMLVILTAGGVIDLSQAIYMILGANVGSCVIVIFASSTLGAGAKKTALFNLVFNALGAILGFIIMVIFGNKLCPLLEKTATTKSGAVANFHTAFNIASAILAFPFLTKITKLTEWLYRLDFPLKSRNKNQTRLKNKV